MHRSKKAPSRTEFGVRSPAKAAAALQSPGGLGGRFLTRLWRTSLGDCGHLI